jgi:TolB-like protein
MYCYKKIYALIFFLLFAFYLNAQIKLTVVNFQGKGISSNDASILTDRFRNILVKFDSIKVYERENVNQIILEQGFQQTGFISDDSIIEIGRLIGVEQIVSGSASFIGKTYTVTAKIIDVKTGEILNSSSIDHQGSLDELLSAGMNKLANQLFGDSHSTTEMIASNDDKAHQFTTRNTPFQISFANPLQLSHESTNVTGLRINIIYGRNQSVYGIDAGLINWSDNDMYGIQAGFYNRAKKVKGIQAGFINVTDSIFGIQIGLFNIIRSSKHPFFPIINAGFSL